MVGYFHSLKKFALGTVLGIQHWAKKANICRANISVLEKNNNQNKLGNQYSI